MKKVQGYKWSFDSLKSRFTVYVGLTWLFLIGTNGQILYLLIKDEFAK